MDDAEKEVIRQIVNRPWNGPLAATEMRWAVLDALMPGPARVTGFRDNPLRLILNDGNEVAVSEKLIGELAKVVETRSAGS